MLRRMDRRLAAALTLAVLTWVPAARVGAGSEHPPVVISQVYGGGGNVGATYTHDFIELFNRGEEPVSLEGWSVQYATAAGSSWTRTQLSGVLAPSGRHLVQQAGGSGGTVPLPDPDSVGTVQMAAGSGKVALVAGTGILPCGSSCAGAEWVVDFVGYGSANDFEGDGPAPTLSNTLAAIRTGDGCTDTDHNAADFAAGPPDPRNAGAEPTPCSGEDPAPDPTPSPEPSPEPSPGPEPSPEPSPPAEPSPDPGCGDQTPPTVAATARPDVLWPPNHRRVQVDVAVTASDDTDPAPEVRLLSAVSSEPDTGMGPGDRGDDVVVMDDRTVLLRAERAGSGPGRIYALTYAATDACGNESVAVAEVRVPHDRGRE